MKRLILGMLLATQVQAITVFKPVTKDGKIPSKQGTVLCLSIAGKYMALGKTAVSIAKIAGTGNCNSSKFKRVMINKGYFKRINVTKRLVGEEHYIALQKEYVKAGGALK